MQQSLLNEPFLKKITGLAGQFFHFKPVIKRKEAGLISRDLNCFTSFSFGSYCKKSRSS